MIPIEGYDFEGPFDSCNLVNDVAGVYVILCLTGRDYTVMDIGESTKLYTRLSSHDRDGCWRSHCSGELFVAVLYTQGRSDLERRKIEEELRDQFTPPCGKR